MVTIRFFAGAAEAAGTSSLQVEIPKFDDGAAGSPSSKGRNFTIGDLLDQISEGNAKLQKVLRVCLVLADGERVEPTDPATEVELLDILPPFAGG